MEIFSKQLLQLGDGKWPVSMADETITFPLNFCNIVKTIDVLINKVFPDIQKNHVNQEWLCERAILAPKNTKVNKLNEDILNSLQGENIEYKSIDNMCDPDNAINYPMEFLNSFEISGLPPHKLILKTGVPVMLLRNLQPPILCNGTRLFIKTLNQNVLEATVLTGYGKGTNVYIPRIPIRPTDLPFKFERLQFPLKLAFTFTINKSQGQSLKCTGVLLE